MSFSYTYWAEDGAECYANEMTLEISPYSFSLQISYVHVQDPNLLSSECIIIILCLICDMYNNYAPTVMKCILLC